MWPAILPIHDVIAISFHGLSDLVGSIGNLSLLIAIIFKSPPSLRTYSVILSNAVFIDFIACITSLITMIRVIPADMTLAYIYLGPCTLTTPFLCHFAYCTMLHTFAHSLYLIIVSFTYRLYVLKHASDLPSRPFLAFILLIVYIPSLSLMIIFLFALDPNEEVLAAILPVKPDFEYNKGYLWTGHASITKFRIAFTIAFMILPCVPAMFIIFYLRSKVLNILRKNVSEMSRKTHEQHSSLVRAFSICSVLQEHLTMSVWSIMPATAPFITIYYVRPYRIFIMKLFCVPEKYISSRENSKLSTAISSVRTLPIRPSSSIH